jgi:NADH-quinone oxidoreductase subunit E
MLSEEERKEIEHEIRHFEYKRGASIEALKILAKHRGGWVSDEGIQDLAPILEMTPEELDSVATFYNLVFRKPVGKHIVLVCDSITCYVMGYETIYAHLREKLGIKFGETTPDEQFTLLPNPCLGTCDHAPALMVDDKLYQDVTPEQLDQILASFRGVESS